MDSTTLVEGLRPRPGFRLQEGTGSSKVAGATRHGKLRKGAQKEEAMTLNLMRYLATAEYNRVADGERFCGGRFRSTATRAFWWSSSDGE